MIIIYSYSFFWYSWHEPCTTRGKLYDIIYLIVICLTYFHIFSTYHYMSWKIMEYHAMSLQHILQSPHFRLVNVDRSPRHRAPRATPCRAARQLGQGPKCGAARRAPHRDDGVAPWLNRESGDVWWMVISDSEIYESEMESLMLAKVSHTPTPGRVLLLPSFHGAFIRCSV